MESLQSVLNSIPEYWVLPLSNLAIVVVTILLLYPLVWKLTLRQLAAAVKAIETAKNFPETIAHLTEVTEALRQVNHELNSLKEPGGLLDTINQGIETAKRQLSDLESKTDEQVAPAVERNEEPAPDADNWERVTAIWNDIKERVEAKIEAIPDGRVHRKYVPVSRRSYENVANYMLADRLLTEEQAQALIQAHALFRSLRNRRTVITPEMVENFTRFKDQIFPRD